MLLCTAKVSILPTACPTEDLIEGKTSVNLTCDASGVVVTRVWMKDGQPLASGQRFSFHDGNRVLSISPVDRKDTGEYLCNVSNDFSFDTAKCNLKVYCKYLQLCHSMCINVYMLCLNPYKKPFSSLSSS